MHDAGTLVGLSHVIEATLSDQVLLHISSHTMHTHTNTTPSRSRHPLTALLLVLFEKAILQAPHPHSLAS
jgi:hypothetical protein